MVHPGLVVHAFGHLEEDSEVLRPQLELALRPAEHERLVRQVARRILAAMPAELRLAGHQPKWLGLAFGPGQNLSVAQLHGLHPTEGAKRPLRGLAHRERHVDGLEHRR